eukprot:tig00001067_g6761.t1
MAAPPYQLPTDKLWLEAPADQDGDMCTGQPLVLVACGSFSPVTYMHLRMMEIGKDWMENALGFRVIGGYLSPVNDAYRKEGLAPARHRLEMCRLAVQDSDWIMVDDWESRQGEYVRTARVLAHVRDELQAAHGLSVAVKLLSGADLLESMTRPGVWQEDLLVRLLEEFGVAVICRPGLDAGALVAAHPLLRRMAANIALVDDWLASSLSSTRVRENVARGRSIKYLTPDPVVAYIARAGLYRPPPSPSPAAPDPMA